MAFRWPATCKEAADEAWRRCRAAQALAKQCPAAAPEAVLFIDSHFPLIRCGSQMPQERPPLSKLPCRQKTIPRQMFLKWRDAVWDSLGDVAVVSADPAAVRVIQKGSPVTTSVRYIGPQLRRACITLASGGDSEFLRDAFLLHSHGILDKSPDTNPEHRYMIWSTALPVLYEACGNSLRSADIKRQIRQLTQLVASQDIGLQYAVRVMYARPLRGITALRAVYRALSRTVGPGASALYVGSTMSMATGGPAFAAFSTSVAPSAKRLRQLMLELSPAELESAQRGAQGVQHSRCFLSAAPLAAGAAGEQEARAPVYALFCADCGEWRSKPILVHKQAAVVIDLDRCEVACQRCNGNAIHRIKVNGTQLRCGPATWARLCQVCHLLGTDLVPYKEGLICKKCHSATHRVKCYCGRPAVKTRVGLSGESRAYVLGAACIRHASLLPVAIDSVMPHALMK